MLKELLKREDTILFVGSGISTWSGIPSWSALISDLAAYLSSLGIDASLVCAELRRGDLLQAASYGFDQLTPSQFGEFVRRESQYGTAQPHEIHRLIVSLGPRCFVTTNYDNLIETSLRKWQPDRFARTITNRHLPECGEIIGARAKDFVFKPHGDAGDASSIVLTREQYRFLLPGGERNVALEALKMLMATRPVIYIGFGLRDPDFLFLRDILANIFKGGILDHYAVMPDVQAVEIDYWKRHYGVHLIGYQTEIKDGVVSHDACLRLLRELSSCEIEYIPDESPEILLSLARHASRMLRVKQASNEFPIYVNRNEAPSLDGRVSGPEKFYRGSVEEFLDSDSRRAILLGLPGAGKSYALSRAAARCAETLTKHLLIGARDCVVTVPVLVDMKLYQGDLEKMIEETLPSGLTLENVSHNFRLKIFIDSFNEMPRQYWEQASYQADISRFLEKYNSESVVIGSRTDDGLTSFGLSTFSLDEIERNFVEERLEEIGVEFSGRFKDELIELLQRPFYFQLITSGVANLTRQDPRCLYESFFEKISSEFRERFEVEISLDQSLSIAAYEAINNGEEAQQLAKVRNTLAAELAAKGAKIDVDDVINWLIFKSIFVPLSGQRISFFHQSITEFLAASEFASRYLENPLLLKDKIALTRWDQALFLAVGLLAQNEGQSLLKAVIQSDFVLAIRASKYLEQGRDEVVSQLLEHALEGSQAFEETLDLAYAMRTSLVVSDCHEQALRRMVERGGALGGAAVELLGRLKGLAIKEELFELLWQKREDYNFCANGLAQALRPLVNIGDVVRICDLSDAISDDLGNEEDGPQGFLTACGVILEGIDLEALEQNFLAEGASFGRMSVLAEVLQVRRSEPSMRIATELLSRGIPKAVTTLYFIGRFGEPPPSAWKIFDRSHIKALIALVESESRRPERERSWAIDVIILICENRKDLAAIVGEVASQKSGVMKMALQFAARVQADVFLDTLTDMSAMSREDLVCEPLELIKSLKLRWGARGELLIRLLRKKIPALVDALFDEIFFENDLPEVDLGPLDFWLNWLQELASTEEALWTCKKLGAAISAMQPTSSSGDRFLDEFNRQSTKYRYVLSAFVLTARSDLTTEQFGSDAISYLLAELRRKGAVPELYSNLLSDTATEDFVKERLLPLLMTSDPILLGNVKRVLRHAGRRHGRRYLV